MGNLVSWVIGGAFVVLAAMGIGAAFSATDAPFFEWTCTTFNRNCPTLPDFNAEARDKGQFASEVREGFATVDGDLERAFRQFHGGARTGNKPSTSPMDWLLPETAFETRDCVNVGADAYDCEVQVVRRFDLDTLKGGAWDGGVFRTDWWKIRLHREAGVWKVENAPAGQPA